MVIGWKHTLNRPFCIIFILIKPYLKVQICNINFWIENDPPPFSENSSVLEGVGVPNKHRVICYYSVANTESFVIAP